MRNQTELDQIETPYSPKGSEYSLQTRVWIFITTKNLNFHYNQESEFSSQTSKFSSQSRVWIFSTLRCLTFQYNQVSEFSVQSGVWIVSTLWCLNFQYNQAGCWRREDQSRRPHKQPHNDDEMLAKTRWQVSAPVTETSSPIYMSFTFFKSSQTQLPGYAHRRVTQDGTPGWQPSSNYCYNWLHHRWRVTQDGTPGWQAFFQLLP